MSLGFPILFLLRTFPKNEKEFSNIYIYILAVFTLLVVENQYPSPETLFDSPFFILIVYMKEKKVLSCTKSITVAPFPNNHNALAKPSSSLAVQLNRQRPRARSSPRRRGRKGRLKGMA